MKRILFIYLLLFLLPVATFSETISDQLATAAETYRVKAEQGNPEAQSHLGYLYYVGEGVPQSYADAVKWYRKAAVQGNKDAQYNLAVAYAFGEGTKQDYTEAAIWYRRAAEQGHQVAQYSLGISHAYGEGVQQDEVEAAKWFTKSAEQGYERAQVLLGSMYHTGDGVEKDYKQAIFWYRKAADRGNAAAQYNMGSMYRAGKGVEQDYNQALRWYRLAADQGYAAAQNELESMERAIAGANKSDKPAAIAPEKPAETPLNITQQETTETTIAEAPNEPVPAEKTSTQPGKESANVHKDMAENVFTKKDQDQDKGKQSARPETTNSGSISSLWARPPQQPGVDLSSRPESTEIKTTEQQTQEIKDENVAENISTDIEPTAEAEAADEDTPGFFSRLFGSKDQETEQPVAETEEVQTEVITPYTPRELPATADQEGLAVQSITVEKSIEHADEIPPAEPEVAESPPPVVEETIADNTVETTEVVEAQETEEEEPGFFTRWFGSTEQETEQPTAEVDIAQSEPVPTAEPEVAESPPPVIDETIADNTVETTEVVEAQETEEEEPGFFTRWFGSTEQETEQPTTEVDIAQSEPVPMAEPEVAESPTPVVEENIADSTVETTEVVEAQETEEDEPGFFARWFGSTDKDVDQSSDIKVEGIPPETPVEETGDEQVEVKTFAEGTAPAEQQLVELDENAVAMAAPEAQKSLPQETASTWDELLIDQPESVYKPISDKPGEGKTLEILTPLAIQGDQVAQYELGNVYYEGKQVKQDYAEAFIWYRRSALQGLPDAQYSLGTMYLMGEGITQSDIEAKDWYEKAAIQGHPAAQHNLENLQRIVSPAETQEPAIDTAEEKQQLALADTPVEEDSGGLSGFFGRLFSSDGDDTEQTAQQDENKFAEETQVSKVESIPYEEPAETPVDTAKSDLQTEETIIAEQESEAEIIQPTESTVTGENQVTDAELQATPDESEQSGGVFSFFGKLFGSDDEPDKVSTADNGEDQQVATIAEELATPVFNSEASSAETKSADPAQQSEVEKIRALAEQNNAAAQERLGLRYYTGNGVTQSFYEALKWFHKAAVQGDSYAQYNLAVMHAFGEGTEQNMQEAVIWYRRAAEQNHPVAQYSLATCYFYGDGVPRDEKVAAEWYLKSAENKYVNAQVMVGNMYHTGQALTKNYKDAAAWYRKAADQGNADAQFNLGTMYLLGNGFSQNETVAKSWFEKAAAQGHESAQFNLDNLQRYREQQQLAEAKAEQEPAPETMEPVETTDIPDNQAIAATQSDTQEPPVESEESAGVFSSFFSKLFGSDDKDESEQVALETTSDETNETSVESESESFSSSEPDLLTGKIEPTEQLSEPEEEPEQLAKRDEPAPVEDISTDAEKTIEETTLEQKDLLRQQAVRGDLEAQYQLGRIYYAGNGVKQDYSEAFLWYRRAALQDHMEAQYSLANMYLMGEGITQNDEEAMTWYQKAALQGHIDAVHNLENLQRGVASDTPEPEQLIPDDPAVNEVAKEEAENEKGFFSRLFSSDEDEEVNDVAGNQSNALQEETVTTATEPENTISAEEVNADPSEEYYQTGMAYSYGEGVVQNYSTAFKYFEKAAELGNASAQYKLGLAYANGEGTEKDNKKSIEWYRKSAENGYAIAQRTLGLIYMNGEGVEKDKVQAYAWFSILSEQGNVLDIHRRDSLRKELSSEELEKADKLKQELSANFSTTASTSI